MDDNFSEVQIVHKDYLTDFENKFIDVISSRTELGDHFLIETKSDNIMEDENSTHNINVAVASAVTSYSRIHMSQFKNNKEFNLYYTDTDSIYVDKPLSEDLISSKILGKLKLENVCNKAIFLSPKVYCLLTENNDFIYKVKGLKHEVELTMNDFETLLVKDALLQKHQTK
jgi:hypothetical protein